MNKARALVGCLLLCVPLLLGCGGDESKDPMDTDTGHPPAEMVGTWIFASVTVDDAAADLGDVMEWQPATVEARLHVQANSAYVFEEVDMNGGQLWFESGFVYIGGSDIDINIQQDSDGPVDETSTLAFTLVADTLTLAEVDAGSTILFTLERDAP